MQRSWHYVLLCTGFMGLAFMTVWVGPCPMGPVPPSLPLDDWDIPQLAAHLNKMGVEVHTVPTQKGAVASSTAFFTVAEKEWLYLNGLLKTPERIQQWQGIVYCSLEAPNTRADLAQQWEDRCLVAGPFIFYGDADLRARIAAALNQAAPANAP
jgi:hypothetical protein